jgi:hypothetical protein
VLIQTIEINRCWFSRSYCTATASDAERQVDRKVVVRAIMGAEWDAYKKNDITVQLQLKSYS